MNKFNRAKKEEMIIHLDAAISFYHDQEFDLIEMGDKKKAKEIRDMANRAARLRDLIKESLGK